MAALIIVCVHFVAVRSIGQSAISDPVIDKTSGSATCRPRFFRRSAAPTPMTGAHSDLRDGGKEGAVGGGVRNSKRT